jgi:endonuclease G
VGVCQVQEYLTEESIQKNFDRKGINFKEDVAVASIIRSQLSDYKGSGFDRGHICPAGDCTYSKEALEDTFYLSNMCPQVPNFNRGKWKELEQYVRSLLTEYMSLEVISGHLYVAHSEPNGKRVVSYQVIGENDVAVPTHFFKIVRSKDKTWAWILPNESIDKDVPLEDFEVTVQKIEKLSGIIFN